MKGGVSEYTEQEQAIREFTAMRRAEFSFRQKIEKQRWERDELVPAVKNYQDQLNRGTAPSLELEAGS